MIDDRGRLFGALNVVDALILVFALGAIPLGYVAYRVFRVPPPIVERVEPASQLVKPELRIRMIGRDLRPYLRMLVSRTNEPFLVSIEKLRESEGQMLIETPTVAEALLPKDLPAGSYDIHLFDGSREIASLPGAFTLVSPLAQLDVVARFPVDEGATGLVHAGDRDLVVASSGRALSSIGYAQIVSVRALEKPVVAFALPAGRLGVQIPARMLEAIVTVPATKSESNVWEYRKQAVRVGDPLIFDAAGYVLIGSIVEVRVK